MIEIEEKGASLRSTLKAIREELGADVSSKVLEALPRGEFREAAIAGRVLAASWYPIRVHREPYAAIAKVAGHRGVRCERMPRSRREDALVRMTWTV